MNARRKGTRPSRLYVCAWALCALLLPAQVDVLRAEETATSDQEKKIHALEQRLAELEKALAALSKDASPAGVEELRRRIDLLAAELEKLRIGSAASDKPLESVYGLGPAASRVYNVPHGVSIGGYGEMLYQNFSADDESGNPSGETDTLDFLRGVLYFGYKFNDRIVFNSEIEYEHGSTELNGSVSLEFAYLDFLLSDHANVRAGMVLVPAGFINELHEPPVYLGARRPEVERRILPTTWRENGVGVFGEAGPFTYRAYVMAGLDSSGFDAEKALREGRQGGSESLAEDLAVTARVDFTGVPGLIVGGFVFHGSSSQGRRAPAGFSVDPNGQAITPPTDPFDGSVTVFDLHAEYKARGWNFRALYAGGRIGDAKQINDANGLDGEDSVGDEFYGWYAQAGYDVLSARGKRSDRSLVPYVRYERMNTQDGVPTASPQAVAQNQPAAAFAADPANDLTIWTLGAVFKPIENVAIKADYAWVSNEAETGVDQLSISLGYLF